MSLKQTPSQTIGPFFAYGLTPGQYDYPFDALMDNTVGKDVSDGPAIRIQGRVFDGNCAAVNDAMIEIWQADQLGRYAHPAAPQKANTNFIGFARFGTGTDPENRFLFNTIKPGSIHPGCAPHINVIVFMRGLLTHVYTRIYFEDEVAANQHDPVLASVPEERRRTLIASKSADAVYTFNIHMQGDHETVFFDV